MIMVSSELLALCLDSKTQPNFILSEKQNLNVSCGIVDIIIQIMVDVNKRLSS